MTNKSQEGSQFCRGFGGIGGILRYQVRFEVPGPRPHACSNANSFRWTCVSLTQTPTAWTAVSSTAIAIEGPHTCVTCARARERSQGFVQRATSGARSCVLSSTGTCGSPLVISLSARARDTRQQKGSSACDHPGCERESPNLRAQSNLAKKPQMAKTPPTTAQMRVRKWKRGRRRSSMVSITGEKSYEKMAAGITCSFTCAAPPQFRPVARG